MQLDTQTLRQQVSRYAPISAWLPAYPRDLLRSDLISGVTVWGVMVPVAMAYALVAAMKAPLFAALFTTVLVQKETGAVIAVAVVMSALLAALLALRAAPPSSQNLSPPKGRSRSKVQRTT